MKKKILTTLCVASLGSLFFALGNIQATSTDFAKAETTIYVSSSGSDTGLGDFSSPYATLEKALSEVENGGMVALKDSVQIGSWTAHNKSVVITGGTLDASGLSEVEINDSVTFENVSWVVDAGASVYANGYETVLGAGVSFSNEIKIFGGGKQGTTVENTNLTVLSGTYTHIYGGSNQATVTGNTHLTVGGAVNNASSVDTAIQNHTGNYFVFGGGYADTVKGATNVVFKENAKAVYLYGGSHGWGSKITKGANLNITGGKVMGVFGGTKGANSGSGTNTRIQGGAMQQVFGGNESFTLTGNVDLRIVGGTITRRIYGGCYDDRTRETPYIVSGKINLELGGDVQIPLNESHSDKGIYARSRYTGDTEESQIVFSSQTAYDNYKNKLGSADLGASMVMGNVTAADTYHYYAYTKNGNTIIQTCAYHTEHTATAEIGINESVSLLYSGVEIEPIKVEYSEAWEYDKPTVRYENNVACGKANYALTIGQVCVENEFIIVKAPVILGASIRMDEPSGLRFQSKISSEMKNTGARFGTLVIPKDELGKNELTINTENVQNIEQTKWATESLKLGNAKDYQEGYEYFNAVLTEIPDLHYDKVIVARSYVYANGQYYYSNTIERSVGQVSSQLLHGGYESDILRGLVDKALADSTLSIVPTLELFDGETHQLTLLGNKGYAAIWSANNDIVSVDENGYIKAGNKEGKAVITAKLGNQTLQCTVVVSYRWTDYF